MPLGVSDALASATCGDLCVSPPGQRRRPTATGRGFSRATGNLFGQHRQGSAAVAKCHPWFLILARLAGQRRGETTSLADFPGCAKSPSLIPCSGVQSRVHERRHVENTTLGRQRAHGHAVDEYREDEEDRMILRRLGWAIPGGTGYVERHVISTWSVCLLVLRWVPRGPERGVSDPSGSGNPLRSFSCPSARSLCRIVATFLPSV